MKQSYQIAPSILSADFAKLGEEIDAVTAAGADLIHFDVMDNHYVPNLTIGPLVCSSLMKRGTKLPIDVHLMTERVDELVPMFAKAGASIITFHPDAVIHVDRTLRLIKSFGIKAGLVLNPAVGPECLEYVMDLLDVVMLMSVNPGFGGQSFIPSTLEKLKKVRSMIDASGYEIRLEVDGGVSEKNIAEIADAGADTFVAGSAIFSKHDYRAAISAMRGELASC